MSFFYGILKVDLLRVVMIMKIYHVTAFPYQSSGGNKAGVVYPADSLTMFEQKAIAKRLNYSETAFVMKSRLADFKVRFFTPEKEVDLCGHATIGTFNTLRDEGVLTVGQYTQQTEAGLLRLDILKDEVYMEQKKPLFGETVSKRVMKKCFNEHHFANEDLKMQIVSTGLREVLVPIKDVETLNKMTPNFKKMLQICEQYRVIGFHLFAFDEAGKVFGRNFAPAVGINEESATGTSNGALACYLQRYVSPEKTSYVFYQGFSMDLPSEIKVNLDLDKRKSVEAVWVGGHATILEVETT